MVYPMTFTSLGDTPIPGEGNQAILKEWRKWVHLAYLGKVCH